MDRYRMSPVAQRITVENRQRARFAKVPHALIDDPEAERPALLLYLALARIANFSRGVAFDTTSAAVMKLARMARRDTFYEARKWLVEAGYLEVQENPNAPWVYAVCDGPEDPPPVAIRDNPSRQNATGDQRETRSPLTRNAPTDANRAFSSDLETLRETTPSAPEAPDGALFDLRSPPAPLPPDPVAAVFDAWRTSAGRNGRTALDAKRRRLIEKALESYPATDVTDAVRGWEHSAFHRGHNERHKPYNDLGLLLRDAEHIERFRDLARGPREPDPAPRTREHVQTDRSVKTGRIQAP